MSALPSNVVELPGRGRVGRLLSLREMSERLGMSERWIRYRVAEGLPHRRYGQRLRFDAPEVERWLEDRYAS